MAIDISEKLNSGVYLRSEDHRYFSSKNQLEFVSVGKCNKQFKEEFNPKIPYYSARKRLYTALGRTPKEHEILAEEVVVKKEWADNNKAAIDYGNIIHDHLEEADNGNVSKYIAKLHNRLYHDIFKDYAATQSEQIIASSMHRIAGTTDKFCQRATGTKGICDLFDYKTNKSKGIQYYSPYSKFFLNGLSHLEDCNYNEYSLQLSDYAYLAMLKGFTIGRLAIIYIIDVENAVYQLIPVPFMMMEAKHVIENCSKNLHDLLGNYSHQAQLKIG